MINVENKLTMQGYFRAEIHRNGEIIRETEWGKNIITDYGLNGLGTLNFAVLASHCRVGTSTAIPAAGDRVLGSQVGYVNYIAYILDENSGHPNYKATAIFKSTFVQGSVIGNITEVGFGKTKDGDDLFNHSLFVDSNENPVTITLTAIDQLIVFYKLEALHPQLDENTGSIVLGGVTYNYTSWPAWADQFKIGHNFFYYGLRRGDTHSAYTIDFVKPPTPGDGIGGAPTGYADYFVLADYIDGNKELKYTVGWGINKANHQDGIKAITLAYAGIYMGFEFDNPIPKTITNQLRINYKFSWGR